MVPIGYGALCNNSHSLLSQLCNQVDEEADGGLRGLSEVLLGYGERHFDVQRKGVWASVLLMCGQFERVRACKSFSLVNI